MNKIPSTEDLTDLGASIHDHGFRPNEESLADIAALARQVRPDWPVLDVVADRAYPEIVRARALSRLSADWDAIREDLETLRTQFEADVADLLTRWNLHDDHRRSDATPAEPVESRSKLDVIRHGMERFHLAVSR